MLGKKSNLFVLALAMMMGSVCADNVSSSQGGQAQSEISAISQTNVDGTVGGVNPIYPKKCYQAGLYVTGDYLYWKAEQDGLMFAETSKNRVPFTIDDGKLFNPDFDWASGFRVGMGYHFNYDGWDLFLQWTDYDVETSRHVHAPKNGQLLALWSTAHGVNPSYYGLKASAHWHLDYDIVDLELGRNYYVSRALSIRPFLGARGAWINQRIRLHYEGLDFGSGFNPNNYPLTTWGKNAFHAGGARLGFNLVWHLNRMWGIYTNVSGSLLLGYFNAHVHGKLNLPPEATSVELSSSVRRVRPNLEIATGLKWEDCFSKGKWHLAITVGYELVQWWSMNQMIQMLDACPANGESYRRRGDLGLQGWTIAARLDF
jgi:hypothetical protein